jgi:hypothetical protein
MSIPSTSVATRIVFVAWTSPNTITALRSRVPMDLIVCVPGLSPSHDPCVTGSITLPALPPLLLTWLHLPPLPLPMTGSFAIGSTRSIATVLLHGCTLPLHTLSFSGSFNDEMKVEGSAVWLRAHAENTTDVPRRRRLHVVYSAGAVHGMCKLFCSSSGPTPSLRCCVVVENGMPTGDLVTFGTKGQCVHKSCFTRGRGSWFEFDVDNAPASPCPPSSPSEIHLILSQILDALDPSSLPALKRVTTFVDFETVEETQYWRRAIQFAPHADGASAGAAFVSPPALKMTRGFKNGLLHGRQLLYARNGSVFTSRSYEYGLLHGALQQFRDDGSLVYVKMSSRLQIVTL